MVSLIPRLSSFAVSGTPARSKVDDLIHVLKYVFPKRLHQPIILTAIILSFLRVDQIVQNPRMWSRLLKPGYAPQLVELFDRYSIRYVALNSCLLSTSNLFYLLYYRTMKAAVQDELTIPKQTRFLVPIELGRVERHVSPLFHCVKTDH